MFADASRIFQWKQNGIKLPQIYAADGALGGLSLGLKRAERSRMAIATERNDPDIWAIPLNERGTRSTGPPQVLIRSTENDSHPDYSPDGRQIVYVSARSGVDEIWVSGRFGCQSATADTFWAPTW